MRTLAVLWSIMFSASQVWAGAPFVLAMFGLAGDVVTTVLNGLQWVAC